jgi:hypothetical protein
VLFLWKNRAHVLGMSEKKNVGVGEAHISKAQQKNVETKMKVEATEEGRYS